MHHAVRMLRLPHLEDDYAAAWAEWQASGEHEAWDVAADDGFTDAPR